MAFLANVTLRTRAIKIPFEIPLRLTPCVFARSDRVFGNLLCKSAALPPQKLPLLAEGEFMLRPAKVRRRLFYSLLQRSFFSPLAKSLTHLLLCRRLFYSLLQRSFFSPLAKSLTHLLLCRRLFYSLLQRRRWRATARRMRRTPLMLYLSALLIHRFAVPLLRWRRQKCAVPYEITNNRKKHYTSINSFVVLQQKEHLCLIFPIP